MSYQRILLKVSGEAFTGINDSAYESSAIEHITSEIAELAKDGVSIAIVVGAGNILRGRDVPSELFELGLSKVTADHMGMAATIMNGLVLRDVLRHANLDVALFDANGLASIVPRYTVEAAKAALDAGQVVICTGGTGNPLFTTDSAACLRGIELEVDVVIKGTQVDGVYDSDPLINEDAKRFEELTFSEILAQNLRVMDLTASALCNENGMQVVVFELKKSGALSRIVKGLKEGTVIRAN